jgi:hypothetical protein
MREGALGAALLHDRRADQGIAEVTANSIHSAFVSGRQESGVEDVLRLGPSLERVDQADLLDRFFETPGAGPLPVILQCCAFRGPEVELIRCVAPRKRTFSYGCALYEYSKPRRHSLV